MARKTCPKCGTAVSARAVICPACDFIVDTSFLEDFTTEVSLDALKPLGKSAARNPADDVDGVQLTDEVVAPAIDALEEEEGTEVEANGFDDGEGMRTIPGLRVQAKTLSGVSGRRATNPRITSDDSQIDTAPHRSLVATSKRSERTGEGSRPYGGEALILGDVSGASADFDSMLSDQTSSYATVGKDLARVFEPTPVYVAHGLKQMIEPSAVLALKGGADPDGLQLSSFERTVIALIDGQRPVARIAKKGAIPMDDLKIAIGMLADRQLLVLKGRVRRKNVSMPDGAQALQQALQEIDDDEILFDVDASGDVLVIEEGDAVDDDELRVQHALDPFADEAGAEAPAVMDMPLGVGPLDQPARTEPTDAVRASSALSSPSQASPPLAPSPITSPIFARARPSPAPLPASLPASLPAPLEIAAIPSAFARPLPAPIASPAPAPISAPAPVTVETRVPAALRAPRDVAALHAPAPFALSGATPAPIDVLPNDIDALDPYVVVQAAPRDVAAPLDVAPLQSGDVRGAPSPVDDLDSPSGVLPVAVGTLVGAGLAPDEQAPVLEAPVLEAPVLEAPVLGAPVLEAPLAGASASGAESAFDEVAVRPAATLRPAMPARVATRVTVVSAPGSSAPGSSPPGSSTSRKHVATGDPVKAEQMLELAFADLRDGRQSRALAYAKMAAKADPQNARAHELLGAWNNPAQLAALAATSATSGTPATAATPDQELVVEAQHAEEARDFAKAADLYKKAIALKPEEPELRNRLGILLALRLKDFAGATSELMRACELAPDNLAYRSNLGKIFKLANGTPSDATMHTGTDDEKLRAAAKKPTLFERLRGKKT